MKEANNNGTNCNDLDMDGDYALDYPKPGTAEDLMKCWGKMSLLEALQLFGIVFLPGAILGVFLLFVVWLASLVFGFELLPR